MKAVQSRTPAAVSVSAEAMPQHEIDTVCRTVLGSATRFFNNPANVADYERWKKERQQKKEQING